MVYGQLTSTVDMLMSIPFLLTGNRGGKKMSALGLVLIMCLTINALVEAKHDLRILKSIEL